MVGRHIQPVEMDADRPVDLKNGGFPVVPGIGQTALNDEFIAGRLDLRPGPVQGEQSGQDDSHQARLATAAPAVSFPASLRPVKKQPRSGGIIKGQIEASILGELLFGRYSGLWLSDTSVQVQFVRCRGNPLGGVQGATAPFGGAPPQSQSELRSCPRQFCCVHVP